MGKKWRGDDEDHQQHQHHVHQGRDIDFRQSGLLAATTSAAPAPVGSSGHGHGYATRPLKAASLSDTRGKSAISAAAERVLVVTAMAPSSVQANQASRNSMQLSRWISRWSPWRTPRLASFL